MEGGFQIPDEQSVYRTMTYGLDTVNYVAQIHDYLVYGHGASWYSTPSLCPGVPRKIYFYCP